MEKSRLLIHLLIASNLTLGLSACSKNIETAVQTQTPKMLTATPETVKPTVNSTVIPTTQNTSLSPTEPELDNPSPVITSTPSPSSPPLVNKKSEPTPIKKVETPKRTALPTPPPATVVVKKEEPVTASNFIIAAYNTMVKEGKKIGAACNFYIERVLEVLGFKTVDFLANDFDVAAKKMFKDYKVVTFTDKTELKRHLWSYRERTGFICQWERNGAPGHVAIIERIGETLWIYQASLNQYTARLEKTTLEHLLEVNNNKGVRVYSDFVK